MPPVPALPTGAGPGASWSKLLSVHNAAGDQEGEPRHAQSRQGSRAITPKGVELRQLVQKFQAETQIAAEAQKQKKADEGIRTTANR